MIKSTATEGSGRKKIFNNNNTAGHGKQLPKKSGSGSPRSARRKEGLSVIISGMPSAGKTTAAKAIAKKFKLKHVAGGDMLKLTAYERGYKPSGSEWWDTKQGMDFLAERKNNPDFDKEVDRRLAQCLHQGNVVITSYSMPWLYKRGLKLWFQASEKTRAKRLAGRDGISVQSAREIVRKRDYHNRRLYKRLYGIEFGKDLSPFNYVIDTEKMDAKNVASASCKLVSMYLGSRKSDDEEESKRTGKRT